jgi:hypothetical protein
MLLGYLAGVLIIMPFAAGVWSSYKSLAKLFPEPGKEDKR